MTIYVIVSLVIALTCCWWLLFKYIVFDKYSDNIAKSLYCVMGTGIALMAPLYLPQVLMVLVILGVFYWLISWINQMYPRNYSTPHLLIHKPWPIFYVVCLLNAKYLIGRIELVVNNEVIKCRIHK